MFNSKLLISALVCALALEMAFAGAPKRHKSPPVYGIKMQPSTSPEDHIYTDQDVTVTFWGVTGSPWILFKIKNTTNSVAQLLWNECTFSGVDGQSTKLLSGDVPPIDFDKPQVSATILPASVYAARAFPEKNYEVLTLGYPRPTPVIHAILPWPLFYNRCCDEQAIQSAVGKKFQIYLPMMLNSARRDLTFTFQVESARFTK